jgi:hypothetical protein
LKKREAAAGTLACLFLASTLWQTYYYFAIYPTKDTLADFTGTTVVEIAKSLQQHEVRKAYFFVYPRMTMASQDVIRFLLPALSGEDITDESHWQLEIPGPGEFAFVFLPERESALDAVKACLPGGAIHRSIAPGGYPISLLYTVAADAPVVCTGP